jgi:hypothetical protein
MSDERTLRRFCRRHRLTPHTVLYEGPYEAGSGLDSLFAAGPLLRERFDDVVVAAIPAGNVDARFRDRCERLALALGHRGIVEWRVCDDERALWRAAAAVVCPPPGPDEPPDVVAARIAPHLEAAKNRYFPAHSPRRSPDVAAPAGG